MTSILATPLADAPRVVTSSAVLPIQAVYIGLLLGLCLLIGDVLSRKEVRMGDVIVIGPFFLILGACTPIGQGIANFLGRITIG